MHLWMDGWMDRHTLVLAWGVCQEANCHNQEHWLLSMSQREREREE